MSNLTISEILRVVKKKIGYILFIGLICAGVLAAIKVGFSDIATRQGKYLYTTTVHIQQNQLPNDFDFKGFLESEGNYGKLVEIEENGHFDFSIVDSSWNRKSKSQQLEWLNKHIYVKNFKGNVISLYIKFDSNVTRDTEYMKEHVPLLFQDFMNVSQSSIQAVVPDATFKTIYSENIAPTVLEINRKSIAIKYAIIGFIIGIWASVVGIATWTICKNKE